jgi:hypothetical protein
VAAKGMAKRRPSPPIDTDQNYENHRLRFARGATNFVTLLLTADAALPKALRFITADAAAALATSAPTIAGMSFCILISPPVISPPHRWLRMAPPLVGKDGTTTTSTTIAALKSTP